MNNALLELADLQQRTGLTPMEIDAHIRTKQSPQPIIIYGQRCWPAAWICAETKTKTNSCQIAISGSHRGHP